MAVIAIYSVKGGVGKTTLAANLAWCSATISCRRTLLWDLDAAGGAGFLLGIEPHGIANVHLWSFCVGVRNALAGVGALAGLWIHHYGDESTGTTVVVVSLAYMLLSSLAMGVADLLGFWRPRGGSVRGTVASSVLPALALIALAF